ncbi:unnamed protein product [Lepeophtheirus salmonis]|uniref:(salmon louse) hypothetical protein n=1 Tax=Lepeophtheirus salmonis TaxID=72036 RepID=A0A7R8CMU1_LEPSM|nr:unnamed protein product [Lepeophtheirus salmonis]CAF2866409.1 unnamed protein product [Lepeophtheirus salmonis]
MLTLDESTDIRDTAQLAVFIRAVWKDFNVAEELLDLNPLKGTPRGVDIFEVVEASLQKVGIEDFRKCASLCTVGRPSMIVCYNGLIAKVPSQKITFQYEIFYGFSSPLGHWIIPSLIP